MIRHRQPPPILQPGICRDILDTSMSDSPLSPEITPANPLTTDKYFINRHHWLLWIPSVIGLFIGMYVGGTIADKEKPSLPTPKGIVVATPVVETREVASKTASAFADWITYTNMIDQYYFKLPRGWSITEEVSSFGPSVSVGNDDPNDAQVIGVIKSPNPTHLTIQQFVKKYYPDQTPIFKPTTVSENLSALQTTFTGDSRNCDNGITIFLPHNDNMFVISHNHCITTAAMSTSDDTIFRLLLSTLRFSDPTPSASSPIKP